MGFEEAVERVEHFVGEWAQGAFELIDVSGGKAWVQIRELAASTGELTAEAENSPVIEPGASRSGHRGRSG